ncbi:MAG: hypothetical protein ACRD0Z_04185 [Acidimicrobiales bacterium]
MTEPDRLLVVGVERSGTTWVARALSLAMGAVYVHEPDSPGASPGAHHARQFGRYPVVRVGDVVPLYERDWDLAFRGGWVAPKATAPVGRFLKKVPHQLRVPLVGVVSRLARTMHPRDRVLTKSVMCAFSLNWIIDRYHPPVVLVRRNALNVVASLIEMGTTIEQMERLYARYRDPVLVEALVEPLNLPDLPDSLDLVSQCAYWVGLNSAAYHASANLHGGFVIADHDALCTDPLAGYSKLSRDLGLAWNNEAEDYVKRSNTEGEGYSTNRITSLEPERWRRTLADREEDLRAILSQFPGTSLA